jgi:hypothetical protein
MSEPFYAPNPRPPRPMSRARGIGCGPFRRISTPIRASCANTASGGIEAQFQKDGELLVGRLFARMAGASMGGRERKSREGDG